MRFVQPGRKCWWGRRRWVCGEGRGMAGVRSGESKGRTDRSQPKASKRRDGNEEKKCTKWLHERTGKQAQGGMYRRVAKDDISETCPPWRKPSRPRWAADLAPWGTQKDKRLGISGYSRQDAQGHPGA